MKGSIFMKYVLQCMTHLIVMLI